MFKFKGISSNDMKVVIEEEEHFLAKAAQKYETIDIEGKDGAIYDELGYSDINRPIKVQILDVSKLDDILVWLNGEGELEYKDRKTMARFYNELEPERNACVKIIDTNFIRAPFWYKKIDNYVMVTNAVINEGNIVSRPIIQLEKGNLNDAELTIGGVRFIYHFKGESYVEIDCDEMSVLYNGLRRNRQIEIGYKFPKFEIGNNVITRHSGDAMIKIKRKDRWL